MDTATAKSVANQKVFVPLSAILKVQADFNRLHPATGVAPTHATQLHLRGMAMVIKTLGLPIDLPNGY